MPDLRRRRLLNRPGRTIAGAVCAALLLALAAQIPAIAADEDVGLKVPRFVSLHSDKVNLRTGPGRQYPIEWVLTRKDMPVEVIAQFEHWRRIRDWEGTAGWVQERMVAGRRTIIVGKGAERPLHQQPDPASAVIFFHGLGLSHMDIEQTLADGSPNGDWVLEENMVAPVHLLYPGGEHERIWLEEVVHITKDGGRPLFSWGFEPLVA